MTCIVGIVEDGVAYMAGDSWCGSPPGHSSAVGQMIKREPKVFVKGDMMMGGNGSVRMIQVIRYEMEVPEYKPGRDKVEYLSTDFVQAMKNALEEDFGRESGLDGGLLIGWDGELFTVNREWAIHNTVDRYDAIGKGKEVAIGSLHTSGELAISPVHRLRLALLAAECHTCVVAEPFHYITNKMEKAEMMLL